MNQQSLNKKYNSLLIETFSFLIKFLDDHDIKYFMACGSAIGAVRHHGMIPWDDDIDIMIYRDDYEKLLSIRDEMIPYGYKYVTYEDDGYYFYHSKVINMKTTLWEIEEHPYSSGVFIDVFFLYRTALPIKDIEFKMGKLSTLIQNYFVSIQQYTLNSFVRKIEQLILKGMCKDALFYLYHIVFKRNTKKYYKELLEFDNSLNEVTGDTLVCYSERKWGKKEIFDAKWFDDFVEFPFENLKVKLPKGYHEMLTRLYGDYMQLPPIEKRVLEHNNLRFYINLSERLTVAQMRERLKEGEKEVI